MLAIIISMQLAMQWVQLRKHSATISESLQNWFYKKRDGYKCKKNTITRISAVKNGQNGYIQWDKVTNENLTKPKVNT